MIRNRKLRQSCERCRVIKIRCTPSEDNRKSCQRCIRDGRECVFEAARARSRQAKTPKTRLAEVEQRVNSLTALLSFGSPNSQGCGVSTTKAQVVLNEQDESAIFQPTDFGFSDLTQTPSPSPMQWIRCDTSQDIISKGIISPDAAEKLLQEYSTHVPYFPFVVISQNDSLKSLRREKPFLLLSILATSSRCHKQLQDKLEMEVRKDLGQRVIVQGEKSLDLLQGLLVYLAWYHYYFRTDTQQFYQLTHMAMTMAVELRITTVETRIPVHSRAGPQPSDVEVRRTFLGCYYLSSSLSLAFREHSRLQYTEYVERCCQELAEAGDVPSDSLLPFFIHLQRLVDDVKSAFDLDNYHRMPPLDAFRVGMFLETLKKRLAQLESFIPAYAWNNVVIRLGFLHLQTYVNEIGLHASHPSKTGLNSRKPSGDDWYFSMARTDALISCLASAKNYLEQYLMLSVDELRQNTIVEPLKLVYVIMVLGRFTSGVGTPHMDPAVLRNSANLVSRLKALVQRMSEVITLGNNDQEQTDFFWYMRRIFQLASTWYEGQIKSGCFTALHPSGIPDWCKHLSLDDILRLEPDSKYITQISYPPADPMLLETHCMGDMQDAWLESFLDDSMVSSLIT